MENVVFAKAGNFFGVYILYNINPKYKGQIYIGFTVNPSRRIRQHNREIKGGAWKTGRNKGPWDMVLITHGFPTKISALQFEWAWQNPGRSTRLSHLPKKDRKESIFSYRIRILSQMLNTGPWNRLALTIHWLKQEYCQDFPLECPPPLHMPIAYGEILNSKSPMVDKSKERENPNQGEENIEKNENEQICTLCDTLSQTESKQNKLVKCILKTCENVSHITCLAKLFLSQSNELTTHLIPISGSCPTCHNKMMWGDVIRQSIFDVNDADSIDNDDDDDDLDDEVNDDDFE